MVSKTGQKQLHFREVARRVLQQHGHALADNAARTLVAMQPFDLRILPLAQLIVLELRAGHPRLHLAEFVIEDALRVRVVVGEQLHHFVVHFRSSFSDAGARLVPRYPAALYARPREHRGP